MGGGSVCTVQIKKTNWQREQQFVAKSRKESSPSETFVQSLGEVDLFHVLAFGKKKAAHSIRRHFWGFFSNVEVKCSLHLAVQTWSSLGKFVTVKLKKVAPFWVPSKINDNFFKRMCSEGKKETSRKKSHQAGSHFVTKEIINSVDFQLKDSENATQRNTGKCHRYQRDENPTKEA